MLGLIVAKHQEGGGAGVHPSGSLMYAVTFRMIVASMFTLVVEPGICVWGRTAGRVNATKTFNRYPRKIARLTCPSMHTPQGPGNFLP